jgi:hypothetical protein
MVLCKTYFFYLYSMIPVKIMLVIVEKAFEEQIAFPIKRSI